MNAALIQGTLTFVVRLEQLSITFAWLRVDENRAVNFHHLDDVMACMGGALSSVTS